MNNCAYAELSDFVAAGFHNKTAEQAKHCFHADHLNDLKQKFATDLPYVFVDQDSMEDARYYEQIIFQDSIIPTRSGSLHDYFNGLIWIKFGKTKALLNAMHWQDIAILGHKHRTRMRDRITHFDECGMLLISDLPDLKARLAAHDWHWLFVENKHRWFQAREGIAALHFGHANLEMLCQPFIGLTAKVLVMTSTELLKLACESQAPSIPEKVKREARQYLDASLLKILKDKSVFQQKGNLLPMPILGIPGWHFAEQSKKFYSNTQYFMPHPSQR